MPPPDIGPDPSELDGNRPPLPDDAGFDIPEDTRLDGTLTARDPDGDRITFALQEGARNGVVVLLETGEFTYTPDDDFFGPESFTYVASNGRGGAATATVSIDVTPMDDPPVAPDATNAGAEDSVITGIFTATDIDSPAAGITYAPAGIGTSLPAGVTLAADGAYALDATGPAYQALAQGEQRVVSFDYAATSEGLEDTATVSITVTGVNDAPVLSAAGVAAMRLLVISRDRHPVAAAEPRAGPAAGRLSSPGGLHIRGGLRGLALGGGRRRSLAACGSGTYRGRHADGVADAGVRHDSCRNPTLIP